MGLFDFLKKENNKEQIKINLDDFKFVSPSHTRFEKGIKAGDANAARGIRVQSNITGIKDAYTVTIYNLDGNHHLWGNNIQVAPKRMKIKKITENEIELVGFGNDEMGASFSDYGLIIHLKNGIVNKMTLNMFDRNVKMEYAGKIDKNNSNFGNKEDVSIAKIKNHVSRSLLLYEEQNITALQIELHALYQNFNQVGGGNLIIEYPEKDKLAECFILHLRYDWIDDVDIREVLTENAFYCLIEFITNSTSSLEKICGSVNLLQLLNLGKESFKTKLIECLYTAEMLNVISFENDDFKLDYSYLVDQFKYFAAKLMQPVMQKNNILGDENKKIYNRILENQKLNTLDIKKIEMKAKYVSNNIYNALNRM